jgi:hypothetical protein
LKGFQQLLKLFWQMLIYIAKFNFFVLSEEVSDKKVADNRFSQEIVLLKSGNQM